MADNPRIIEKQYDLVVVGGGLSGMFAAIAAARHGAKTAIVQARSMFGGNASSEIRMHIVGAGCHNAKKDLNETGLLMELLLTNKRRNPLRGVPGMGRHPLGDGAFSGGPGFLPERGV